MSRVVITHSKERFNKSIFLFTIKVRPGCEHAVVVRWRGPDLSKPTFRNEAFVAHSGPERTADSARVGSPVEDGPNHFHLAGPGVTMFAQVAVETQRPVVPSLLHALLLQKVNGQNRCVATVAAADRERPVLQIREGSNRASGNRNDLRHPIQIRIAHGDRTTHMSAPLI